MRILYTNFHQDKGGGHVTYIRNLLKENSHEKFVACPPSSRLYQLLSEAGFEGLIPMEFPSSIARMGQVLKSSLEFKRVLEKFQIDIVHTNGSPDNRIALYASILSRRKFKVIFTKHNTKPITGVISKWRLNHFNDAVIFVSDSVIELAGLKKENPKYHVVEHGIDLDHWKRQSEITTGNKLRLVSNAGTQRHKGWQHMWQAFHSLPEEARSRLAVVVLGRYDAKSLQVSTEYDFNFPGFVEDPRPYLEAADIGFVLSDNEASSFASREMSAMSLPVISSDFPNHVRNIDKSCGWVVRRGDFESVRETLLKILDMSPAEIDKMKQAARKKAEESFSLEKMLIETNEIYEAVMRENS